MEKLWCVKDCHFIELPQFKDHRGKLSFIENTPDSLFQIKRMYFLYDVPHKAERAGHGHKNLHQLFFALSGSYTLHIDDGREKMDITMDTPYRPFYICPLVWRVVSNFTSGATCVVLASELYDESDYIRDYNEFLKYVNSLKN